MGLLYCLGVQFCTQFIKTTSRNSDLNFCFRKGLKKQKVLLWKTLLRRKFLRAKILLRRGIELCFALAGGWYPFISGVLCIGRTTDLSTSGYKKGPVHIKKDRLYLWE